MRRATWILWLMLALLPLRGWATTTMGLPQAPVAGLASVAATVTAAPDAMAAAVMPRCHQDADSATASSCQVCDWCHAALGIAPAVGVLGSVPPAARPAAWVAHDTGLRPLGGLDRPPRPVHT